MRLSFWGAAGEVTGSRHLLEAGGENVLLDCGLFQGHRKESIEKNKRHPVKPGEISAALLSHAHIDHSGALPLLAKEGFSGSIHCTQPTKELCAVMLMDSAHLQEEDARFFNKIHAAGAEAIEPLYSRDDVLKTLDLLVGHPYEEFFALSPGLRARFLNAGHVLGSAMIEVEAQTPKGPRRILFTGDLGRRENILIQPPLLPKNVDYLLIESTYGDRLHEPLGRTEGQIEAVINEAVLAKGKILIPSFALERTQEVVYVVVKLRRQRRIPDVPIYVDSPMALEVTRIFERHLDYLRVPRSADPFGLGSVRYVRTPDESKSLNDLPGPLIIISASGMCEGGRILHHLRNALDKGSTTVLIVGYQAEGTLGRRLADGASKVKIFGLPHEVRARIRIMHTFSAHADKDDLAWFIQSLSPRPRDIFLVHGDPSARDALAARLKSLGIERTERPGYGERFDLS